MSNIAPIAVPNTTGVARSFGHMRLNIAGMDFNGGYQNFDYGRERQREYVMSNSPDPVAQTLGENHYHAEGVFLFDWWAFLLNQVQTLLGPGYGDAPFDIFVPYVGVNLVNYTDWLVGCKFDSTDAKNAKGIGALTRPIKFNPMKIYFAGVGGVYVDDLGVPLVLPLQ